jgi:hypothetical protein
VFQRLHHQMASSSEISVSLPFYPLRSASESRVNQVFLQALDQIVSTLSMFRLFVIHHAPNAVVQLTITRHESLDYN